MVLKFLSSDSSLTNAILENFHMDLSGITNCFLVLYVWTFPKLKTRKTINRRGKKKVKFFKMYLMHLQITLKIAIYKTTYKFM